MVSQKNAQQSAGLKKYLSRSSGVVGAAGHGSTLRNKWGDGKWRLLWREGKRTGSSPAEVIGLRKGFKKNTAKWLGKNDEFRSAGPCDLYPLLFKELVKWVEQLLLTIFEMPWSTKDSCRKLENSFWMTLVVTDVFLFQIAGKILQHIIKQST